MFGWLRRKQAAPSPPVCSCGAWLLPVLPAYGGGTRTGFVIDPSCPDYPHPTEACPAMWHEAARCNRANVHHPRKRSPA